MKSICTGLLAVVLFLSCAQELPKEQMETMAEGPAEAHVGIINRLRQAYVNAYNSGQTDRLLDHCAADVIFMPPSQPPVRGRQAAREMFETLFEQFSLDLSVSSQEVVVAADWAFDRGTYTLKRTNKSGGKTMTEEGTYIAILQRAGEGPWKISRHIWNFN